MTFDVGDGKRAEVTCHAPTYPRTAFAWIPTLFGDQNRWIQLDWAP